MQLDLEVFFVFSLVQILFTRHIARIFRNMDSSIIDLRFSGGPFGLPGFCSGVRMPSVISSGCSPVFAGLLYMSAINSNIFIGAYFISSAFISSIPELLLFSVCVLLHLFLLCGKVSFHMVRSLRYFL